MSEKYDPLDDAESFPKRGADYDPLDDADSFPKRGAADDPLNDANSYIPGEGKALGQVDRYQLNKRLGAGSFGEVYLAWDTVSKTPVAIKMIPDEVARDEEEMEEVRYNFSLTSRLKHPHIASLNHLHEVDKTDTKAQKLGFRRGDFLVIMEYAAGTTLFAWRRMLRSHHTRGTLPWEEALEICRQIAEALDYAHSQKVIHRDIKPKNVMIHSVSVAPSEKYAPVGDMMWLDVKVLDFGLAADIRSSLSRKSKENKKYSSSGTFPYMSPEQWRGQKQGSASDQYSLAVLFYELVSGEVPFQSVFLTDDKELMLAAVSNNPVEPLEELDQKQNAVLLRALSKNPEERFATCSDFIAALAGGRISKPRNTRKKRSPRETQKITKGVLVGVCAIAVMGVGYLSYSSYTSHQAEKAEAARVAQLEQEKQAQIKGLLETAQELFDKEHYAEASEAVAQVLGLDAANATAQKLQDQIEQKIGPAPVALLKQQAQKAWDEVKGYGRGDGFGDKQDAIQLKLDTGLYLFGTKNDAKSAYAYFRDVLAGCSALQKVEKERQHALSVKRYNETQIEWDNLLSSADKRLLTKYSPEKLASAKEEALRGAALSSEPLEGISLYERAMDSLKEATTVSEQKQTEELRAIEQQRLAQDAARKAELEKRNQQARIQAGHFYYKMWGNFANDLEITHAGFDGTQPSYDYVWTQRNTFLGQDKIVAQYKGSFSGTSFSIPYEHVYTDSFGKQQTMMAAHVFEYNSRRRTWSLNGKEMNRTR